MTRQANFGPFAASNLLDIMDKDIPKMRVIGDAKMTGAKGGKTWFCAVITSIMARECGLLVTDNNGTFFVPPGTPPEEALPLYV